MEPDEFKECSVCGGPVVYLGTLGRRIQMRCRDCGLDCSETVPDGIHEPNYLDLTARQIIRRKHGESRNFMTPRILGYGRLAPNVAYELSTGSGFLDPNPIYGVSVVAVFHRAPAKRLDEKSKCFAGPKARTAVRAYLDDLRAEFKGLSEYNGSFVRLDPVEKAQDVK